MLDSLTVGFWGLTYICIILYSFRYKEEKKVYMPFIAGALNFSWELHALYISGGYWGHIVWLGLDCFILIYNLYILQNNKRRLFYAVLVAICFVVIYGIVSIPFVNGMLISSFAIDIIMAMEYFLTVGQLSSRGQLLIGLLRLFGDLFAWFGNMKFSSFVMIVGLLVLIVNFLYICCCLELQKRKVRGKYKKHRR